MKKTIRTFRFSYIYHTICVLHARIDIEKKIDFFSQISCMVVESAVCAPVQPHPHMFTAFFNFESMESSLLGGVCFQGQIRVVKE